MELKLRKATSDDYNGVIYMLKEVMDHVNFTNSDVWNKAYPINVIDQDIARNSLYILEGVEQNIIAIFALEETIKEFNDCQWEEPGAQSLYLARFAVHPNYQGLGLGKFTLNVAMDLAKKLGAVYLRLLVASSNYLARDLYQKYGFKQVKAEIDYPWNKTITICPYEVLL